MSLTIEDYSDKSFVVYGENTKIYIEKLKELGGKYNSNLKMGPGWIFSKTRKDKVNEYFNNIDNSSNIEINIEDYSDKSFVVHGENTKKYINKLKELGGKYNSNLKMGPGWIFSKDKKEKVEEYFNKL
jgi:hypothetical protein